MDAPSDAQTAEEDKDDLLGNVGAAQLSAANAVPTLMASGVLSAAARMTVAGEELQYEEPADAATPLQEYAWRMYIFKKGSPLDEESGGLVMVNRQRYYLFGRDSSVAHVQTDHMSCSKQHAVMQYRMRCGVVTPYIIDLDSRNGTRLNSVRILGRKYVELKSGDVLQFGASTREYVFVQETP
jgi:smad nuclear-interacting protein 1